MKLNFNDITLQAIKTFITECPKDYTEEELFNHYQQALTPGLFACPHDEASIAEWGDVVTALYNNAKGDKTAPVSVLLAADKQQMADIIQDMLSFFNPIGECFSQEVNTMSCINIAFWRYFEQQLDEEFKKCSKHQSNFKYSAQLPGLIIMIGQLQKMLSMQHSIKYVNLYEVKDEGAIERLIRDITYKSIKEMAALGNYEQDIIEFNDKLCIAKRVLQFTKFDLLREAFLQIII